MNPHLTSNMTAYTSLSSPCSPFTLTHTHTDSSQFPSHLTTHMALESLQLLPSFPSLSHTHTHRGTNSALRQDGEREEEVVQGRKSQRNVRCVTVTFDGDKCESAAIQLLSFPMSLPLFLPL